MNLDRLKAILNNSFVNDSLLTALNKTFEQFEINTELRQAHFLSQIIHESGGFRYVKEIASGEAYENRDDLGNTSPGDGVRYKGRGYIQITGKNNYIQLSKYLGVDFVTKPELLEQAPYNMLSAGWYWNSRNLNKWADKDDVKTITMKINGGLNGFIDRQNWLVRCKEVLKC
jgi:putative chitinase